MPRARLDKAGARKGEDRDRQNGRLESWLKEVCDGNAANTDDKCPDVSLLLQHCLGKTTQLDVRTRPD